MPTRADRVAKVRSAAATPKAAGARSTDAPLEALLDQEQADRADGHHHGKPVSNPAGRSNFM